MFRQDLFTEPMFRTADIDSRDFQEPRLLYCVPKGAEHGLGGFSHFMINH